jgi:protein gp37
MAEWSKIEWTDHTFNPWIGCTKVSPACDGCYAEHLMAHRLGRVDWGAGEDRKRTGADNWRKPIAWNRAAATRGRPTYVFCASLADVFDNEVDPMWRRDLFDLIEKTPNLTWLLLTKRVGNVVKMTDPLSGCRMVPPNAAIGATMANQEEYDRDRMKLHELKHARDPRFTFGSFEPLLGPIILDKYAPDLVITGGETDQGHHKARHADPAWFRSMRDQCAGLGRAFFMKQMTKKAPIPDDLMVRAFPIVRALIAQEQA